MATYLILDLVFMTVTFGILAVIRRYRPHKPSSSWLLAFIVLITLTIVFDSLLVSQAIVAYDARKITGIIIGAAPIEDLSYALLATLIIPLLWNKQKG